MQQRSEDDAEVLKRALEAYGLNDDVIEVLSESRVPSAIPLPAKTATELLLKHLKSIGDFKL